MLVGAGHGEAAVAPRLCQPRGARLTERGRTGAAVPRHTRLSSVAGTETTADWPFSCAASWSWIKERKCLCFMRVWDFAPRIPSASRTTSRPLTRHVQCPGEPHGINKLTDNFILFNFCTPKDAPTDPGLLKMLQAVCRKSLVIFAKTFLLSEIFFQIIF